MSRRPIRLTLLLCVLLCLVLPAQAALADDVTAPAAVATNDGGLLTGDASVDEPDGLPPAEVSDALTAEPGLAEAGLAEGMAVAATPNCQGAFFHSVSNVYFRMLSGRLNWDFYLTNQARQYLGPIVTVSMPFALVNGRAINPPYSPHTRVNWYDFHSSMYTYSYIGGGGGTIRRGDAITLYWLINGSIPGRGAYRYITCRIP